MTPDQVAQADDLGSRTYATISGSVAATYVETYTDDNGNGTQEAGETGTSWYYFLVDPATKSGVTIRSTTPPKDAVHVRDVRRRARGRELHQGGHRVLHRGGDVAVVRPGSKQVHRCHRAGQRDAARSSTSPARSRATMTPVRVAGSRAGGYLRDVLGRHQRRRHLPATRRSTCGTSPCTTPRAAPGSSSSWTRTPNTRRRPSPGCSAATSAT